jgi:hypothetical protein
MNGPNNSRNMKHQFKTIESTPKIRIVDSMRSIGGGNNNQPY